MIPKYLCICQRGNVRSVTCATFLRDDYEAEALAIGYATSSPQTVALLSAWADRIVILDDRALQYIDGRWLAKIKQLAVGEDRWLTPHHPELREVMHTLLADWLGPPVGPLWGAYET